MAIPRRSASASRTPGGSQGTWGEDLGQTWAGAWVGVAGAVNSVFRPDNRTAGSVGEKVELMKKRRSPRPPRRRNPAAQAVRSPAFRLRIVADRRKYQRSTERGAAAEALRDEGDDGRHDERKEDPT